MDADPIVVGVLSKDKVDGITIKTIHNCWCAQILWLLMTYDSVAKVRTDTNL